MISPPKPAFSPTVGWLLYLDKDFKSRKLTMNIARRARNGSLPLSAITKSPELGKIPVEIEKKPSISNTPKTGGNEATKKDLDMMLEFNTLEKKFESWKKMTVDEDHLRDIIWVLPAERSATFKIFP
jgi:hypothetical protein